MPPGFLPNPGTDCNASGLLDDATNCSNNIAPDVIEKFALDPGWGHYEAIGLQRWSTDSVAALFPLSAFPLPSPRRELEPENKFRLGRGWQRASARLAEIRRPPGQRPLRPRDRPLTSSQLADVVIGPNGSLSRSRLCNSWSEQSCIRSPATTLCLLRPGSDPGQSLDGRRCPRRMGNGASPTHAGYWSRVHGFGRLQRLRRALRSQRSTRPGITIGFWQDIYKGDLGRAGSACNMNT